MQQNSCKRTQYVVLHITVNTHIKSLFLKVFSTNIDTLLHSFKPIMKAVIPIFIWVSQNGYLKESIDLPAIGTVDRAVHSRFLEM